MKEQYISQRGFILKKIPYSDADEIITVLLNNDGIRRFFVAGSRKSKKKFQGVIDHFNHLDFHYKSNANNLWRLFDADLVVNDKRSTWDSNITHYAFANYLSEIICDFIPEAINDHSLYDFWIEIESTLKVQKLNTGMAVFFILQILKKAGYEIDLKTCLHCSKIFLSQTVYFDYVKGGFACENCTPVMVVKDQKISFDSQFLFCLAGSETINENLNINQHDGHRFLKLLVLFSQNIMQTKSKSAEFFLTCFG